MKPFRTFQSYHGYPHPMDRTRFSHIAHRGLTLCNPAGSARVDRAIQLLQLPPNSTALDIGAGKCEWLARIATRYQTHCTAIEPAHLFAQEARGLHSALIANNQLTIIESTASDYLASHPTISSNTTLCIGSSHAFETYHKTLDALIKHTKPGGTLILGEGYWKKKPDPDYLKLLGGEESELTSHAANIQAGIDRGLTPLWCTTVTDDEWDEYEWTYSRNIENFIRDHPTDPDAPARLTRSRSWRNTVMNGGRDTLGFGLYLFRAPG